MNRTVVNFFLDAFLLFVFLSLVGTSVVLRFVFPTASAAGGWQVWGATYDQWADMQFGVVCVMALGVLVHVMLHWSWVCGVIASRWTRGQGKTRWDDGQRTLIGVGTLIVLLNVVGAFIAAAALSVAAPPP